jgi:GntR family transcriptional regulator
MRLTLSQASGVPFYRQIERQLTDRIRAGQLTPGTLLPSVRQLAAELLVSVITVKQAYTELEAAGLIASRQGRGTFVAEGAAASARGRLVRDLAAELDATARRAANLDVPREALEDAFRRSIDRYFQEKKR